MAFDVGHRPCEPPPLPPERKTLEDHLDFVLRAGVLLPLLGLYTWWMFTILRDFAFALISPPREPICHCLDDWGSSMSTYYGVGGSAAPRTERSRDQVKLKQVPGLRTFLRVGGQKTAALRTRHASLMLL